MTRKRNKGIITSPVARVPATAGSHPPSTAATTAALPSLTALARPPACHPECPSNRAYPSTSDPAAADNDSS